MIFIVSDEQYWQIKNLGVIMYWKLLVCVVLGTFPQVGLPILAKHFITLRLR